MGQDIPDAVSVTNMQTVIANLPLSECWDILDSLKKYTEEDKVASRNLLQAYPQLVFVVYEILVSTDGVIVDLLYGVDFRNDWELSPTI